MTCLKQSKAVESRKYWAIVGLILCALSGFASGNDAYLESNPKTLVNLIERFGPNTRYEVDFQMGDVSKTQYIMGASDDPVTYSLFYVRKENSGAVVFYFYIGDKTNPTTGGVGGNAFSTRVTADTQRHVGVLDRANNKAYLVTGGEEHGVVTLPTSGKGSTKFTSSTRLTAFADAKLEGSALDISRNECPAEHMRLYGVKIYESGKLIRDYKPVRQAGIAGLKDAVQGTFVTSLTTDTLTSGGDIQDVPDDAYVSMVGEDGSYVGRYFNVDLYPPKEWGARIEIDYAMEKPFENKSDWYLCSGAGERRSNHERYLCFIDGSAMKWVLGPTNDVKTIAFPSGFANVRRTSVIDLKNKRVSLMTSGCTNYTATTGYDGEYMSEYSLKFGSYWDGNSGYAPLRFYELRVYTNDIPFRCWKPYVTNGIAVMRDVVTVNDIRYRGKGLLVGEKTEWKNMNYRPTPGGLIESDRAGNAYLESDGTQAINTGYRVKPTTKIEIDCQYTNVVGQSRIFGVNVDTTLAAELYAGGNDGATGGDSSFVYGTNDKQSSNVVASDVLRHTAILDLENRTYSLAGVSGALDPDATIEGESGAPLILFARTVVTDATPDHPSIIRLYSCRIYERGALVHEYLPYKDGVTVGLKDSMTGDVFTDVCESASPFKVGGCGFGAEGALISVPPQDASVSAGDVTTLSVFAPAATAYQWYRNGEAIEGATAATYDVPWERLRKPRTVEYSVEAKFDRYGVPVECESGPATVTMNPLGSLILLH